MNTDGNIDGTLSIAAGIDTRDFDAGIKRMEAASREMGDVVDVEGIRMQQSFSKIGMAAAAYFSFTTLKQFADSVVEVRGEIEALEISFETLIGSKDKADALFSSIKEFAVNTPMTMNSLASGAQTLLGFGIEAEKVMPILEQIGDISMGDAQKFQSLTLAFSQASSTGKLMGQDFLQMVNAGFNPLAEISRTTGISIKQLKEDMENGLITVERLQGAFASATAEGGKYHGMLEKQSKGIKGAISNLRGAVDDMMNDIGSGTQGIITGAVDMATTVVKNYESIADAVLYLATTYGVYKAALVAVSTVEKVKAEIDYETEAAALGRVIAMKVKDTAATGAEAAAEAAQLTGKDAKIAAMKAEVASYIESLRLKEKALAVQYNEATTTAANAALKLEAAQAESAAAYKSLESLGEHATFTAVDAAETRVLNAEIEEKAAMLELEAARQNVSTIATQKDNISTQIHAATTELDAAAQLKDASASKVAASAKMLAKKAQDLWNASMLSSPIFWIAAAITGVVFLVYKLATAESAAEKAQKKLNDERDRFNESLEQERQDIENCINIIQDKTQTDYDQIKAYERLKQICPEITDAYTREELAVADLANTSKILNERADEQDYQHAIDELNKWRNVLDEAISAGEDWTKLSDGTNKDIVDNFGIGLLKNKIPGIEKMVEGYQVQVDEIERIRKQAEEESTPIEVRIITQTEVVSDLESKLTEVRDELDAAQKESETNPLSFNLFARVGLKMQYDSIKEQLNDAQSVLDNLVAQQPETYESAFNNAKKAYDEAYALVEKMKKNRADYTQSEFFQAQETLKDAKKAYEDLGGEVKSSSNLKNEAKKMQELLEQIKDIRSEGQRKVDESQLKVLEDGKEKRLRTIELERQQTIAAIDKEQKELEKKLSEAGQKLTKSDTDGFDARRANANALASAQVRKTEAENAEYVSGLYRDVSDVFLTEEQRKISAIKQTYSETRKQLQKDLEAGNLTQRQYDELMLKNNKAEEKEIYESWIERYGDYRQRRIAIIERYNKEEEMLYKEGTVVKDENGNITGGELKDGMTKGNVDELRRQRDEAVAAVDEEIASRSGSYQRWLNEISSMTVKQLRQLLATAKKALEQLKKDPNADPEKLAEAEAQVKQLESAIEKASLSPEEEDIEQWRLYASELDEVGNAIKSLGEDMDGMAGEAFAMFGSIMQSTSKFIQGIADVAEKSMKAMESTADTASKAIAAAQSSVAILAIIQAIYSAVVQLRDFIDNNFDTDSGFGQFASDFLHFLTDSETMLENLAWSLLGPVGTLIGVLTSNNTNSDRQKHIKEIERLTKEYENVNRQLEEMERQANETFGESNAAIRQQQIELKELQIEYLEAAIAEEEALKNPDNDKIDEWKEQIADLRNDILDLGEDAEDAIFGEGLKTAIENFGDALVEAWESGKSASEAANDYMRKMIKQTVLQAILDYTQASAKIEAIRQKLKEYLENDGIISEDERLDLERMAQELMDEVGNEFEWAQGLFEGEREGSQRGIATASQESVDENNARLTTIQGHTYSIVQGLDELNLTANEILAKVTGIEANTSETNSKLDNMNSRVRNIESTVDDIQRNGIRLKN